MAKPSISLAIITKNEARNIERCIRSVTWADEVIVLDSDSSDETVSIAQRLGAKVFIEEWRGFKNQKTRAVELASHDWIISLDGDEALSPELSKELEQIFAERADWNSVDGFESPRISFYMGRWIRHGGWYPDWQLRFFNRKRAQWQAGHLHERVFAANKLRLKNPIQHWPFENLEAQIETNNRYSTLGAQDLRAKGQRFSLWKLSTKPISKFIETYIVKRGFQDGLPGFIVAVGAAYSVFLKWSKLWLMESDLQRDRS